MLLLGYLPDEGAQLGVTTLSTLAGVDTVVYRVTVAAGGGVDGRRREGHAEIAPRHVT